jgi:SpoVK/Ycf46/Vps4 family AAA+-type ATPase
MKKFLLIAMLVAFNAQADVTIVQASGTGDTCLKALAAAKRSALEKTNGSFLHSVERSENGSYNATIEEFSGGVIKSFKYLRDDCTFVIIEAQVVRRSNLVQFTSIDLKKDQIEHLKSQKDSDDKKQKAVRLIDNRREAVYFKPEVTTFNIIEGTSDVAVEVKGTFAFKDKWKEDYKDVREQFGWYNLASFSNDASVLITGLDGSGKTVFTKTIQGNVKWNMWYITSYGVNRSVEVRIHETDSLTTKFRVPLNQLESVKTFKVEVI